MSDDDDTAPDPEQPGVVTLSGRPGAMPKGVWFAQVADDGTLARDDAGRLIRVRSPHRPTRAPLGG